MKVLVACEESQEVCKAFRELGHEAYSCDIEPCSGGHPEWHLQCDALELLKMRWDMILAFPPCTYLNQSVGQLRLLRKNYPDLWALMLKWDKDSPVTFKADGHTVHDYDRRFSLEDEGLIAADDRIFRWSMLDDDLSVF